MWIWGLVLSHCYIILASSSWDKERRELHEVFKVENEHIYSVHDIYLRCYHISYLAEKPTRNSRWSCLWVVIYILWSTDVCRPWEHAGVPAGKKMCYIVSGILYIYI